MRAFRSWPLLLCGLAVAPVLVGFSANDSTGFRIGGGLSHARVQYATGCSPRHYYAQENTEIVVRAEYVQARNEKIRNSPAMQVKAEFETVRMEKAYLGSDEDGDTNPGFGNIEHKGLGASTQPSFALKGGLAWEYLEVSVGFLVLPGEDFSPFLQNRATLDGPSFHLMPSGRFKIFLLKPIYGSIEFLNGGTSILDMGILNYGLGFQRDKLDFWLGVGLGVSGEAHLFTRASYPFGPIFLQATGSIQPEVVGKNEGLPLGKWGHLGVGFSMPISGR
jgi:hypothetical protein